MSAKKKEPPEERALMDLWIKEGAELGLRDCFGNERGRKYANGNPLFDEKTGTTKDLFAYVVELHPDRPWRAREETRDSSPNTSEPRRTSKSESKKEKDSTKQPYHLDRVSSEELVTKSTKDLK
jgi:hypothetical protein